MGNNLAKVGQVAASAVGISLIALWGAFHFGILGVLARDYDCENMKPEIVALSEKNAAQNGGITIVGIMSAKPVSTSKKLIECTGKAKWSNATDGPITYKAYVEDGQWWLQFNPG